MDSNNKKFKTKRISGTRRVGEKLKFARTRKRISLETAEEETKIRAKYLEALENDEYDKFSSQVYAIGFLRRYSEFLGLDPEKIITEQKNEHFENLKKITQIAPKKVKKGYKFAITPRFFGVILAVFAVLSFLFYIFFQIKNFSAPPPLTIISPANDTTVKESSIIVKGKTDPGAILTLNNELVMVETSGEFEQTVQLLEGVNSIEIRAKNRVDKQTVAQIQVYYQPEKILDNSVQNEANNSIDENNLSPSPSLSPAPGASNPATNGEQ